MNTLTPPCQICQHKSTEVRDTIPLCSHHAIYVADNLVKLYQTPRQKRPIGIARVLRTTDDIDEYQLRCDKSFGPGLIPHTWWGGIADIGDICYRCLREHVAMFADSYAHVIRRLDSDSEDPRYAQEVIDRGEPLVMAVMTGLIPQSLATTIFNRWCENSDDLNIKITSIAERLKNLMPAIGSTHDC